MGDMIVSELGQAWSEFARALAHLLPRLLTVLIIAIVGWVIAYLIKIALRSLLRLVKFDRLSERAGASQLLKTAALPPPSACGKPKNKFGMSSSINTFCLSLLASCCFAR